MPIKQKVAFYGLWPEQQDYVQKKLHNFSVIVHNEPITLKNIDPETTILAVFVNSSVTKDIIAALPKLKYITVMSTGYDHVDLLTAKKQGIMVSNVPTYGENTVAEQTFALILALTRKLLQSIRYVKEGIHDFHDLSGMDLKNKIIGIIGTGHIGGRVARIAKGFEMNVLAYDLKPNQELAEKLEFKYVSLKKLLQTSDIITLHAPLFKENYHLINKKNITITKRGALIINTARGGLVDSLALLEALDSGQVGGAALDVLEDENWTENSEKMLKINKLLINHTGTIVTPHNAFNSKEALQRIVDVTVENIQSFMAKKIKNIVT